MNYPELFTTLVSSIGSAGVTVAAVVLLGRTWLEERLKRSVEHQYNQKLEQFKSEIAAEVQRDFDKYKRELNEQDRLSLERWSLKYKACLAALEIVDKVWTHQSWNTPDGSVPKVQVEDFSEADARTAMNGLALTCSNSEVVALYLKALNLHASTDTDKVLTGDTIQDLRNAIRRELGFGSDLELNREIAWIALLQRKEQIASA